MRRSPLLGVKLMIEYQWWMLLKHRSSRQFHSISQ